VGLFVHFRDSNHEVTKMHQKEQNIKGQKN